MINDTCKDDKSAKDKEELEEFQELCNVVFEKLMKRVHRVALTCVHQVALYGEIFRETAVSLKTLEEIFSDTENRKR